MEAILSNNVLVLNRLWQAVNICSVKRAFMLLYQGHAQVVEAESGSFQTMTFDQWFSFSRGYEGADVVSTVSFTIRAQRRRGGAEVPAGRGTSRPAPVSLQAGPSSSADQRAGCQNVREGRSEERRVGKECRSRWS